MKLITLFLVGFVLGFSLKHFMSEPLPRLTESSEQPRIDELKQQLQSIADRELVAYTQMQDANEKLRLADELLNKAFVIFLANIGVQVSSQVITDLTTPRPVLGKDIKEINEASENDSAIAGPSEKFSAVPLEDQAPALAEKKTESKADGMVVYQNFKNGKLAKNMKGPTRRIMGNWNGVLAHTAGKKRGQRDSVWMRLDFQTTGNKLEGTSSIRLTNAEGHTYSNSNGDGDNQLLRLHPTLKNSVYLEVAPMRFFLLDMSTLPRLRGDYYEADEKLGTVELRREGH